MLFPVRKIGINSMVSSVLKQVSFLVASAYGNIWSTDDKVSVVKKDKIQALAGGGEDSVAYIMLYRAVV